jgi:hypothetical protein
VSERIGMPAIASTAYWLCVPSASSISGRINSIRMRSRLIPYERESRSRARVRKLEGAPGSAARMHQVLKYAGGDEPLAREAAVSEIGVQLANAARAIQIADERGEYSSRSSSSNDFKSNSLPHC